MLVTTSELQQLLLSAADDVAADALAQQGADVDWDEVRCQVAESLESHTLSLKVALQVEGGKWHVAPRLSEFGARINGFAPSQPLVDAAGQGGRLERALRNWLLDRLESYFDFDGRMSLECGGSTPLSVAAEPLSVFSGNDRRGKESGSAANQSGVKPPHSKTPLADIALVSVAKLADVARQDTEFQ